MATTQIDGFRQIKDATIKNQQIAADAAIATTKLAEGADFIKRTGTVPFTADQPMGGFKITGLGAPSAGSNDAARMIDVETAKQGLTVKDSVRLATIAALPSNTFGANALTATANGALTVDGVVVAVGNRILVKNEAAGENNGIYTVTATGNGGAPYVLTRADDADVSADVKAGMHTYVNEGSLADSAWVLSTEDPIVLNTTSLSFTQFASGNFLSATNFVDKETPTGSVNGINVTFTLANTPVAGSEHLFQNGLLQEAGAGNDYTIAGNTITYLSAPLTGDRLRVSYRK